MKKPKPKKPKIQYVTLQIILNPDKHADAIEWLEGKIGTPAGSTRQRAGAGRQLIYQLMEQERDGR